MYRESVVYNENRENRIISDGYKELFQYRVNGKISFEKKDKIKFFQIESRKIKINKENGETEIFYGSIEKLAKELEGEGFVRIHKSYLVNYIYVKQFSHNKLILDDGQELSVSRKYSKEARKFFTGKFRTLNA
ncbi:MAG: LytTR family transcriptional regulator [Clostridioides sp.]|jgi:DNA-binding LytR/AlgR family response regulator|nr:LytTR family transcriptional regulator [Clostridioides sp.]